MSKKDYENIVLISDQWLMYLRGGYSFSRAVQYTRENNLSRQAQRALKFMNEDLEAGVSVEEAIKRCQNFLPPFYINMFRLGVKRGELLKVLPLLKEYYKTKRENLIELEKKLYYPIITFVAFICLLIFSTRVFLPGLVGIFHQLDLELPLFTVNFIYAVEMFLHPAAVSFYAAAAISIFIVRRMINMPPVMDKFLLTKAPILKKFLLFRALRRYIRALQISLSSGGEITSSLNRAARISGSSFIIRRTEEIVNDINAGKSLMDSAALWLPIPDSLKPILKSGERSGQLIKTLKFTADYCQQREKELMEKLNSNLEPAAVILLAGLVALMALALLLPLWELYGGIINF